MWVKAHCWSENIKPTRAKDAKVMIALLPAADVGYNQESLEHYRYSYWQFSEQAKVHSVSLSFHTRKTQRQLQAQ